MRIFIEPNTQAVIGNNDLPRRVVSGPAYVWPIGQRVHSQMSTLPQWLTFTSQECPTAGQVPVTFQIDCKWSRNLAGFSGHQLYTAARVPNDTLEKLLQQHLAIVAAHYASFYPVEALVGLPGWEEQQLAIIKRHHRRLAHCLSDEMARRLGYIGLVISDLSVNVTLPAHLQAVVTEFWHLQKFQNHLADLTQLKLGQAISRSQVLVNFILGRLAGPGKDEERPLPGGRAMKPLNHWGVSRKDFLN